MKNLLIAVLVFGVFFSSGCAKRIDIVSIEKERVDQNLMQGNKGFIMGNAPPLDEPKIRSKTRKIYQVTVELPEYAYKDWNKFKTVDKELWGNRGYIYGGQKPLRNNAPFLEKVERFSGKTDAQTIELPSENKQSTPKFTMPKESIKAQPVKVVLPKSSSNTSGGNYKTYVVQKNDTLGKISKKMYGTTTKWMSIYNANQGVLKNPDKIYPGQKIKIPQE